MDYDLSNYGAAVLQAKSEREVFGEVVRAAQSLGFRYCSYVVRLPLPLDKPHVEMFSNYPRAWRTRYAQRGYLSVDPAVRHGMTSLAPMTWSDPLFADPVGFWEEARSYGLRYGWVQSCRDANGVLGILILAREWRQLSTEELSERGPMMSWLAQMTHLELAKRVLHRRLPEATVILSDREVAVLRLAADGLTAQEVALKLNIAVRTAKFHLVNCCRKMRAPNKTAAAIRAALLGLI